MWESGKKIWIVETRWPGSTALLVLPTHRERACLVAVVGGRSPFRRHFDNSQQKWAASS
jgi:hypothetical protein